MFVRDGESVVIGGILTDNVAYSESKVPFLGDIPILGWLFKSTSETHRKVNLLIILTPHIVRDPEDLEKLTIEQRERFRDAAKETLEFDEQELDERKKALEAGIQLPTDKRPVRRTLQQMTERYPTEDFPLLQQRQRERSEQRRQEREEAERALGGAYTVQLPLMRSPDEAVELLRSLIEQGYDGTLLSQQEGDETVHTVQLGPYASEVRAQQVAREVRAATGRSAQVIVEP